MENMLRTRLKKIIIEVSTNNYIAGIEGKKITIKLFKRVKPIIGIRRSVNNRNNKRGFKMAIDFNGKRLKFGVKVRGYLFIILNERESIFNKDANTITSAPGSGLRHEVIVSKDKRRNFA